jgi:hypothetical protein
VIEVETLWMIACGLHKDKDAAWPEASEIEPGAEQ